MKSAAAQFINKIKRDAYTVQSATGIPASVMIAQACYETHFGKIMLRDLKTGTNGRNLFGIKGTGPLGSVECWTDEYYKGVHHRVIAKFRAYDSYEQSFADYSELLLKPRFAPCMAVRDNHVQFALRLQECGYSGDPAYAAKLIRIMKMFDLEKPDNSNHSSINPDAEKITVILNDKKFEGVFMNGVSYVPVRNIFETLGFTAVWDSVTKTLTLVNP